MIPQEQQAALRARFNPDGSLLRRHQLRMLEMLKYIDRVCRENDIPYWLSSGTCLGAVRHGGFIPWDDDVDIEMLEDDYHKFTEVVEADNNKRYVIQTHKNDAGYILPFDKFRDLASEIIEDPHSYRDYKYKGIFIDLFQMTQSNSRIIAVIGKYLFLGCWKTYKINNNIIRRVCRSLTYFLTFDVIAPFMRFINRVLPTTPYLRHGFGSPFLKPRDIHNIFPLQRIQFEGYELNIPGNVDKYLKDIYGDYMHLPDPNKIIVHAHHISINED